MIEECLHQLVKKQTKSKHLNIDLDNRRTENKLYLMWISCVCLIPDRRSARIPNQRINVKQLLASVSELHPTAAQCSSTSPLHLTATELPQQTNKQSLFAAAAEECHCLNFPWSRMTTLKETEGNGQTAISFLTAEEAGGSQEHQP